MAKKSVVKAAKQKEKGPDLRTPGNEDKKLGAVVRARRLEICMSQERLAEIIGVTFQQVQKYEKGANRIATTRLFAILEAINLSFEEFVERMGLREGMGERQTPFPASGKEARVAVLFRKASPAIQERLVALMEAMVDENGH